MATITVPQVNAWMDGSKLNVTAIDVNGLEQQIVAQVFSRLSTKYDTTLWTSAASTPTLVQSVVSMIYAGRKYQEAYAIDSSVSNVYGDMLIADANKIIESILLGQTLLVDSRAMVTINTAGTFTSVPVVAAELVDNDPKFSMDTEW